MSWSNRIFRHVQEHQGKTYEWFTIHEAFYNDQNKVDTWTEEAIEPYGETVDELISHLEQMLADAKKSKDDILEYK